MRSEEEANKLAMTCYAMSWHFARKYRRRPGMYGHLEDLQAEAFLGIMRAARLYDESRGTKFSTLAAIWAIQYASSYCARHRQNGFNGGRGLPVPEVTSASISKDDGISFIESFGREEPQYGDSLVAEEISDLLAALDKRSRQVVQMRVFDELTLGQCGERLGLTKERVRQIQVSALRRIEIRMRALGMGEAA